MSKLKKAKKLAYKNDWGYHAYTIGGKNIESLKEVEINGKKYKVCANVNSEIVYDMGHSYEVASNRYYVKIPFAGVYVNVYLDDIVKARGKVLPTKYTLL